MTAGQIGLPSGLLVLIFLFTLFIDRRISLIDCIVALYQLPLSIMFAALSFVAAFVIAAEKIIDSGLFIFIGYIIIALLMAVIWRRAERYFESERFITSLSVGFLGLAISIPAFYYSVKLVVVGI